MATTSANATVIAQRPAAVTAAAALLAVLGVVGLITAPLAMDGAGAGFVVVALAISLIRLAASAGVWRRRRWAAFLGFTVSLLDSLLALPGVFFAGDVAWQFIAGTGVILGMITMIMLALRSSRQAYA